jgi:RNA polymerase sigma factor (sigma-70 family)
LVSAQAEEEERRDVLSDDEVTELLAITVPRLQRRLGPGASPAFDVDDLVQDALERALALKEAGREIGSLPAWIQVVVLNLRRDEWRRLEAEARALARAARERPGVDVLPSGDREVLDHLDNLAPRQREVLALHYYADMSVETIARRLGIDAGTVKSTLHRGRRALGALLRPPDVPITAGHLAPADQETPMPNRNDLPGWMLAGSHPHEYEYGILDGELHHDNRVAYLRCVVENATGFGTVMQIIDATTYRDTRLRLSGFVRSVDAGWCGLWMRVDEPNGTFSAFDNMQERRIEGTTPWRQYEIVLDVGDGSAGIAFGILLTGEGEAQYADFRLEEVPEDVPTTGGPFAATPQNLDFSEG